MKLAISGQLLGGTQSLPQILEVLRSLGVDAIDLWPHNLEGGEAPEERGRYERKDVGAARRALDAAGVSAACVTLGFRAMARCGAEGPGAGTEALRGAVDAAAALGAPLVNCYLAGLPPSVFVEAMRPAAGYAGSRGVTIVLENEAHDDSGPAESVRAMIDAVGSPHFGALYDPCNFYHANEEPYPYAYEVLEDTIRYVHLKGGCWYNPKGRPGEHRGGTMRGSADRYIGYVAVPEAAFNVDAILRRLARDGYDGFVSLEPHVPAAHALDFYDVEVPYVRTRLGASADAQGSPARPG